jgi:hypothetical protein
MAGGHGEVTGYGYVWWREGWFSDNIYRNGSRLAVAAVYDRRGLALIGSHRQSLQ